MPKTKGDVANQEWFKENYSTVGELDLLRKDLMQSIDKSNNDDVKRMARLLLKNTCTDPVAQNLKVFMNLYPSSINRDEICEFLNAYRDKELNQLRKNFSVIGKDDPMKKVNKRFNQRK